MILPPLLMYTGSNRGRALRVGQEGTWSKNTRWFFSDLGRQIRIGWISKNADDGDQTNKSFFSSNNYNVVIDLIPDTPIVR